MRAYNISILKYRIRLLFLILLFLQISSALFSQINFYIEADTTCYVIGQPIVLEIILANNTENIFEILFPCDPPSFYTIDGQIIAGAALDIVWTGTIYPGQQLSFTETHTSELELGFHTITGGLFLLEEPPNDMIETAPIEIEIIENVSSENYEQIPERKLLLSNYPNPFNPETTINFTLREAGNVSIDIFNIKGQKVKTLVNDYFNVGKHTVKWDGKVKNGNAASGVYFYKMRSGKYSSTKKMILMK